MNCQYCGRQVLNKCEFCPNCGKPLNNFNSAEDYYNQGVNTHLKFFICTTPCHHCNFQEVQR